MNETVLEVLRLIQASLWQLIAIVALILFRKPLTQRLQSLTTLKAGNLELGFAAAALEAAEPQGVETAERDRKGAAARAVAAQERCAGRTILWVDDNPEGNRSLAETYRRLLGVEFRFAEDTERALEFLRRRPAITMVITDMRRGDDEQAGLTLLRQMAAEQLQRPTVIYLSQVRPDLGIPPGAFAVTNRPDELLHSIIDTCERAHWAS